MTKRQHSGGSSAAKDSSAQPAPKRRSSAARTKASANTSSASAAGCAADDKPRKRKSRSSDIIDAEREFTAAAIARGDAQYAGPDGKLPPGATHEITDEPSGERVVRRRRF